MENDKEIKNESDNNDVKEASSRDFIVEKIKERPINKKRLTRRMLFTAGMAVIFGSVACLSFLLLEPVIERVVSGGTKDETVLTQVSLTEAQEEELPDYEMTISDSQENGDDSTIDADGEILSIEEIPIENLNLEDTISENNVVSENIVFNEVVKEIELDDYQKLYRKMYSMAHEASKSVVTVTIAGKSQDIFNDEHVNPEKTTGLIVAENGSELLILADAHDLPDGKVIVTFCDGTTKEATRKAYDEETGLAIYSVVLFTLSIETRESVTIATLGNSNFNSIIGSPVIIIGDPMNTGSSLCYGAITSNTARVYVTDGAYQLLNTDCFASKKANGILVNIKGQVIGIVCQRHNSDDMKNLVSAYGISSIKNLIEDMSNGSENTYLGLEVKNITNEALISLNIPSGVYIAKVDMDSPAMNVGIIPGDIIIHVNDKATLSVSDYMNAIRNADDTVSLGIMRLSGNEYKAMQIQVKPERK